MNRRITTFATAALTITTLAACGGGSGKAKSTTTSAEKSTTTTAPTTTTVDPNLPKPVVGTNGVTVTYASANGGRITPRVMASSESVNPAPRGGALFRLTHGSESAVWGAVDGQLYNELSTRPGWTMTKLSSDPTWSPAGCAAMPSAIVGDRWMVTVEGAGGDDPNNPTNGPAYNQYFVRVYDRQTNSFTAVTPLTANDAKRWQGPIAAVSPTEIAIVGRSKGYGQGEHYFGDPEVIRTINLETMTFTDAPYDASKLPDAPKAPSTESAFDVIFNPVPASAFPQDQPPATAVWFIRA